MKITMNTLQGSDMIINIPHYEVLKVLEKVRERIPDMKCTYYTRGGIKHMLLMGKRIIGRESYIINWEDPASHPEENLDILHLQTLHL